MASAILILDTPHDRISLSHMGMTASMPNVKDGG
jgi:hypothetical protein